MPLVPVNAGGVVETRLQELTGEVRDMQKLYEIFQREEGQGAVEYALVVLGIAAIISLAVAGFATEITNFMSAAGAALIALVP